MLLLFAGCSSSGEQEGIYEETVLRELSYPPEEYFEIEKDMYRKYIFDIYKIQKFDEMEVVFYGKPKFLQGISIEGVSFENDQLTPDVMQQEFFDIYEIERGKLEKYFVYTPNMTMDHRISMFVIFDPAYMRYAVAYVNPDLRLNQIYACFETWDSTEQNRGYVSDSDLLPEELLPPKLPDLSIGISTP
jgi:hypothetical protein